MKFVKIALILSFMVLGVSAFSVESQAKPPITCQCGPTLKKGR